MSNTENPQLFGTWRSYKAENLNAVMEKAGAPWMARKMAANTTSVMTIERVDDTHIKLSSKSAAIFSVEVVHELNGTIETTLPMQGKKSVYTEWKDGKLVCLTAEVGSDVMNSNVKQIRSIEPNGDLLVTTVHGDVTGYRWFKREA